MSPTESTGPMPQAPKLETVTPPSLAPQGKRPKPKRQTATFLGADAMVGPASSNFGGKTLMGQ